ncbi:hypothetical protein T10_4180 [Trichinella papuae]|uniref:Uncharacterized protein n=1 Tax=Trichinella papuae TaxID=268474 RepID=A0A0V1MLL8_9BILA|nr:hypothetical protein T10_4180 [Trichinella papuae]
MSSFSASKASTAGCGKGKVVHLARVSIGNKRRTFRALFDVMLYFLEEETVGVNVIHDSLEACNTVRDSKWNAFELVKSSASFEGRIWFVSSVDVNLIIRTL